MCILVTILWIRLTITFYEVCQLIHGIWILLKVQCSSYPDIAVDHFPRLNPILSNSITLDLDSKLKSGLVLRCRCQFNYLTTISYIFQKKTSDLNEVPLFESHGNRFNHVIKWRNTPAKFILHTIALWKEKERRDEVPRTNR